MNIDMIRAARSVDAALGSSWVSVGHSQGGHAALHAAHRQPAYAPELPVKGAVAIAPVSNLENLFGPSSTLLNLYQYIHDKLHEKEEQNPKQKGAGQ